MLYYPIDTLYIYLVLPALAFSLWAQFMVTRSFSKYSRVISRSGITGAVAASTIMRRTGVMGAGVQQVSGRLSDHFDPKENVVRLSDDVYNKASVAAIGIAAHEAGHAAQYADNYMPIKIRAAIIPLTRIGSFLAMPLISIGLLINMTGLVNIGIILFGAMIVFQLITLPIEFDASRRALAILSGSRMLMPDELDGARKVLNAAALTYVGALVVSLAHFIRFVLLSELPNRKRRR